MANATLDPDAQEKNVVYDQGGASAPNSAHLKSLETENNINKSGSSSPDNKAESASSLSTSESSGNYEKSADSSEFQQNVNRGSGFYNSSDSSAGKKKSLRSRLSGFYKSKSKLGRSAIIGGSVGAGALITLIIVMFIFISTLLIPGLAQNILTYEFARVERQLTKDTSEDLSESANIQAAGDDAAESASLSTEFASDGLFQTLKNLNPDTFLNNLQEQGLLTYNYETVSGLRYLKVLKIGSQTIDVPENTLSNKILHPVQNYQDNVQFANDVGDALENVYPDGGIGVIIRGQTEQSLMDLIDAPRFAWVLSKFTGKTPQQADLEQQTESEEAIDPGYSTDSSLVSSESTAISESQTDLEQATSAANALDTYNNDGIPAAVQSDINGAASGTAMTGVFSDALKFLNPAYAIFLPVCIIYDGSITSQYGPQTIQTNSDEDERSFFYVEAAADQQKYGDTNGEAVGAFNAKLGSNISDSIPEERANGQTVNTSQVSISPQTAGDDQFTAFNALLPSSLSGVTPYLNGLLNKVCPLITNPYLAGVGAVGAIVGAFTGIDEEAAAPIAADQGVVESIITKLVAKVTDTLGLDEAGTTKATIITSKLFDIFPDKTDVIKIAGIVGLDWIVRIDTAMKAGELNDGLSQQTSFADQADAGANLNSNLDMQQQFYGEPLSPTQVGYNNIEDNQYIASEYKTESIYDRYISPSNPDSLLAKVGLDLYGDLNKSFLPRFISTISKVFNPSTIFSDVYNLLDPSAKVMADTVATNDDSDYGIVQWGYTDQEENLINNNSSYQPLQNEAVLNQSSAVQQQVQEIATTYTPCFTQDMSVLLTSDPSQGDLPSGTSGEPYIVRDSDGNVVGGLCSGQYLGLQSSDPNAKDPSNGTSDLIFRWRLQQAYLNTADTLNGIANASSN